MRHSLHVAPLTDVHAPLHAPSNWSAVFHFVTPLTDMCISLHAPSNQSAIFCFVTSLTDIHAPLHAPSDQSAISLHVAPLTDMRTPLHAPSDLSAIFHFIAPLTLIGVHTIYMFLLLNYAFSHSHETLTLPLLCPNGSCTCTRHDTNPP